MTPLIKLSIPFTIDKCELHVSAIARKQGGLEPILFLHGFGSTKEDYADIARRQSSQDYLSNFPFIAYDAPGCGETWCADLSQISIPFLVDSASALLTDQNMNRFHLIGHSMGGLTGLMLAHQIPDRILSFTNIEGNLMPEDCFLSRQINEYDADDMDDFFDRFIERTYQAPAYSNPIYAIGLRHKVRQGAVRGIFTSMVELSDNDHLMDKFLNLPCPRMFMYGDQNRSLSYLQKLQSNGVRLAEIPYSGHFPMYANPPAMWNEIESFLRSVCD